MLLKRIAAVILLLTVVAFLVSSVSGASTRSVQFELRYIYDISEIFGELEYQLQETYVREYNREGDLLVEYSYDSEERLQRKLVREYDKNGNEIKVSLYDGRGNLLSRGVYKYDDEGNRIEENLYESSGTLQLKSISTYGDHGDMLQTDYYNSDGKGLSVKTYEYDQKGNRTKEVTRLLEYDVDYEKIDVYTYDDDGNVVEKAMYGPEEHLLLRWVYEYDERGGKVKETCYRGDSVDDIDHRYIYTRNASGDVLENVYYTYKFAFSELQETPERKSIYEYDYSKNDAKTE